MQDDLNKLMVGDIFDSTDHASQLLTLLFFAMTYAPGLPLLMPLSFVAFVLYFRVDKFLVCRYYRKPLNIGPAVIEKILFYLPFAALLRLGFACWMFSSQEVLPISEEAVLHNSHYSPGYLSFIQHQKSVWGTSSAVNKRLFRPNVFPLFFFFLLIVIGFLIAIFWKQLPFHWILKLFYKIFKMFFGKKKKNVYEVKGRRGQITFWELKKSGDPERQQTAPYTEDFYRLIKHKDYIPDTCWEMITYGKGDKLNELEVEEGFKVSTKDDFTVHIKVWQEDRIRKIDGSRSKFEQLKKTYEVIADHRCFTYNIEQIGEYYLAIHGLREGINSVISYIRQHHQDEINADGTVSSLLFEKAGLTSHIVKEYQQKKQVTMNKPLLEQLKEEMEEHPILEIVSRIISCLACRVRSQPIAPAQSPDIETGQGKLSIQAAQQSEVAMIPLPDAVTRLENMIDQVPETDVHEANFMPPVTVFDKDFDPTIARIGFDESTVDDREEEGEGNSRLQQHSGIQEPSALSMEYSFDKMNQEMELITSPFPILQEEAPSITELINMEVVVEAEKPSQKQEPPQPQEERIGNKKSGSRKKKSKRNTFPSDDGNYSSEKRTKSNKKKSKKKNMDMNYEGNLLEENYNNNVHDQSIAYQQQQQGWGDDVGQYHEWPMMWDPNYQSDQLYDQQPQAQNYWPTDVQSPPYTPAAPGWDYRASSPDYQSDYYNYQNYDDSNNNVNQVDNLYQYYPPPSSSPLGDGYYYPESYESSLYENSSYYSQPPEDPNRSYDDEEEDYNSSSKKEKKDSSSKKKKKKEKQSKRHGEDRRKRVKGSEPNTLSTQKVEAAGVGTFFPNH